MCHFIYSRNRYLHSSGINSEVNRATWCWLFGQEFIFIFIIWLMPSLLHHWIRFSKWIPLEHKNSFKYYSEINDLRVNSKINVTTSWKSLFSFLHVVIRQIFGIFSISLAIKFAYLWLVLRFILCCFLLQLQAVRLQLQAFCIVG